MGSNCMSSEPRVSAGKTARRHVDTKCRYAYKNCHNPRTLKDNGDLHSLCALHRDRANLVQKAYARKRRSRKRQERLAKSALAATAPPPAKLHTAHNHPTGTTQRHVAMIESPTPIDPIPYLNDDDPSADMERQSPKPTTEFTLDDVQMLRDLMYVIVVWGQHPVVDVVLYGVDAL
ncbi:hypothetical protein H310_14362 [Aphanomyces invadans]|uniref:Uncharacterized protein n=1 Tax=Aphanomyces invadans TaxID=157072 RepID=A0A024TA94_9STRA|nr:hypothetical protein H310_14362 [Aphanomyces invadans]ETV90948.1 hypothetical protein H310_14362 [Aphanomyces invadans]|eukprot:XP_008880430.1 hypothetical protein H310_14362 [Aphanomyces invadans]